MRRIPALIAVLGFAASAAGAQTPADSAASRSALLTLDQKTKISEMITKQTPPLSGPAFPVSVDGVVPSEIQLKSLPSEAEELAPQLSGFSYVVVEELVAIVDPAYPQGGNRISEMGEAVSWHDSPSEGDGNDCCNPTF